jgi:RHH-type proline utilization regulon transcriptional repressor/proline dehydrogenase/delta 1-pyrroline-5-carboxylate dehydrogenase
MADVIAAIQSYDWYQRQEFGRDHDHFLLIGQDNFCRYRPVGNLRIRIHPDDTFFEIFARACAAKTVGGRSTISIPPGSDSTAVTALENLTDPWAGAIEFVEESDEQLAEVIRQHQCDRIRYADPCRVPRIVRQTVADTGIYIADRPVLQQGRIELLWYLTEQSLSVSYHRYGNLGARATELRREPL